MSIEMAIEQINQLKHSKLGENTHKKGGVPESTNKFQTHFTTIISKLVSERQFYKSSKISIREQPFPYKGQKQLKYSHV